MTPQGDADRAALEPFFAAARVAAADRADADAPRLALLSAILADAAAVQAARAAAAVPGAAQMAGPPAVLPPARRALAPIGGWRGLAALAACAALGFWLGIAGDVSLGDVSLGGDASWSNLDSAESTADQVGAFFDLAAVEG